MQHMRVLHKIHQRKRCLRGWCQEYGGAGNARYHLRPKPREEFMNRLALGGNLAANCPSSLIPCEHHHRAEGCNH